MYSINSKTQQSYSIIFISKVKNLSLLSSTVGKDLFLRFIRFIVLSDCYLFGFDSFCCFAETNHTPTNHSHAKPLSVPILVNYFL